MFIFYSFPAEVASGVVRGWTSRKYEYWRSIYGRRQAKDFLSRSIAKESGKLLKLRIIIGLLT
jgi:hypothetical protein